MPVTADTPCRIVNRAVLWHPRRSRADDGRVASRAPRPRHLRGSPASWPLRALDTERRRAAVEASSGAQGARIITAVVVPARDRVLSTSDTCRCGVHPDGGGSGRAAHRGVEAGAAAAAVGRALEIEQGVALPVYGALRAHGYVATNREANLQFAGVHLFSVRDDGVVVGGSASRWGGGGVLAALATYVRSCCDDTEPNCSCRMCSKRTRSLMGVNPSA